MKNADVYIMYSPQKSITTQKLIGRRIEGAFESVSTFLKHCTTALPSEPSSIDIVAHSASGDDDVNIAKEIGLELEAVFGKGKTTPLSYHYPSGQPSVETRTEWELYTRDLNRALDFIIGGQPWPKYTFGPVELILNYWFKFVNPTTKDVLPNQEINDSSIMIWLSRTNNCSPTFYFPFTEATDSFNDYIATIESFLPFKFERKHLRIVKANKERTKFSYRKII